MRRLVTLTFLALLLPATPVSAMASHAGWPEITGMLLMNTQDQSRPLDGRPGQDLFDGTDPSYSCDGLHAQTTCLRSGGRRKITVVPSDIWHNELLGGHGNDTIHAGPAGDVVWGDYKPCCQSTTQVDYLYGGPGKDHIYASHGTNYIYTGGGSDVVHAHFGRGEIHCDSRDDLVYLSRRSQRLYKIFGCRHIDYRPEAMRR
jgi:hypothetical protein